MNADGTGFHACKECHKTESLWNHTTTDHKVGEQLEDRGSVGASRRNGSKGPILDVYDDDESKKLERKRETEKKKYFLTLWFKFIPY